MSWSVSTKGKVSDVVKHLEDYSTILNGQSKIEYDDAMPHLIGLVKQNFDNVEANDEPAIEINANGSGYASNEEQINRSFGCSIVRVY